MVFQIGLYYLNFNRIDMKKELRSRVKNLVHLTSINNPENSTNPCEKKKRVQKPKHAIKATVTHNPTPTCQVAVASLNPTPQTDTEVSEAATDVPSNLNLEDYIDDICNHIAELDKSFHDRLRKCMKEAANIEITSDMRKILIKWLIKVGRKFRVRSETMHMCVQIIDYMLINRGSMFNKTNFQLLGVTCLFISCKYNEIYTIESEKYVEICDGIYTVQQLFEMESTVLLELNFNLQIPNIYHFLSKFMTDFRLELMEESQNMIKCLADMFVLDFNRFNSFAKCDISIVIMYFVSKIHKLENLKSSLAIHKNKIDPDVFKECLTAVVAIFKKSHFCASNISI